jgi:hypothetical protein
MIGNDPLHELLIERIVQLPGKEQTAEDVSNS